MIALEKLDELIRKSTPGEWEAGDRYGAAGVIPRYGKNKCAYCENYPESIIVWEGGGDINGTIMRSHIHRLDKAFNIDHMIMSWNKTGHVLLVADYLNKNDLQSIILLHNLWPKIKEVLNAVALYDACACSFHTLYRLDILSELEVAAAEQMKLLDVYNTVELLGWYGGDNEHALSAWTSTSRDLTLEKEERIPKLLKFLADNNHETPFEKSNLHFLVTCDIASHIHLLRHRIGVSVSAESARYKELKDDKYHIPEDWDGESAADLMSHVDWSIREYHKTIDRLINKGISRKRAKESARYYLPYATQITSDVMFNFRSFIHFQKLRNDEHAQLEIQEIAKEMLYLVRNIPGNPFQYSLEAFRYE